MDKVRDHGCIKAVLNSVTGKHHHPFIVSDPQNLELISIKDSVLIFLVKELGQKLTEKTLKLVDGILKLSTWSWLTVTKIHGNGQVSRNHKVILSLELPTVLTVLTVSIFTLHHPQTLMNLKKLETNNTWPFKSGLINIGEIKKLTNSTKLLKLIWQVNEDLYYEV